MQFGSIDSVVLAIQEDAQSEVEKIDRDLAAAIARLREEDAALPMVVPDADARIAAAQRQVRDRLAAQEWADYQAALTMREAWVQKVIEEGTRRVRALDPAVARGYLTDMVRDGVERMPDETLDVLVPEAWREMAETLLRDGTLARFGKTIGRIIVSADIASGCLVQTADGRLRYDNSDEVRARRLESAWRARLGELYDRGLELTPVGV
jgi:vacuolar-type H+-ATPase subunit E/Vma4